MLIISNKSRKAFKDFLKEERIEYIETIDNDNLDPRLADHPDLSIYVRDDKSLIIDKNVSSYYRKRIQDRHIINGEETKEKYPFDAIYNVYKTGDFYIHNNYTEKHIPSNSEHIYVKQGYTRCSIVPMKDLFLTSDYGIYKKLKSRLDVRLLKEEDIELDGFSKGFLGGCCGFYKGKLLFNGNIEKLKSYDIIKKASEETNTELVYPKCELLDTGSLLEI